MSKDYHDEELIFMIKLLMEGRGSTRERMRWLEILAKHIPNPDISDLIFWPKQEMSPEETFIEACKYRPIILPAKLDE